MRHALAMLAAAAMFLAAQPALAQGMGQGTAQGRGQGHGMGGQPGHGQQMRQMQTMHGRSFELLDQDKDGFISPEEFQQAFTLWDSNKDGRLDRNEWQGGHGPGAGFGPGGQQGAQTQAPSAQAIQDEYKAMDRNKDGRVDFKEFQRRYPDMVRMEFRLIDADGSKWISIQEWESFRTAHGAMQPGEAKQ